MNRYRVSHHGHRYYVETGSCALYGLHGNGSGIGDRNGCFNGGFNRFGAGRFLAVIIGLFFYLAAGRN